MWYKAALEYMGKGVEANLTASQLRIDKPVVMVAGEEDVVGAGDSRHRTRRGGAGGGGEVCGVGGGCEGE